MSVTVIGQSQERLNCLWNACAGLVSRQGSTRLDFHTAMDRQGSTGTEWHSAMSRYDSLMSQLETTSNASSQPIQDAPTPDMDESSPSPPHRKVALLFLFLLVRMQSCSL